MDVVVESHPNGSPTYVTERFPVNIEFQDLTYTVPQGRKVSKVILRSVSGEFKSGQLTAILGPSGAGKSTLLNILAGYKFHGATGSVLVNDKPRNMKQFRRISRYIMQEDMLQPWLTVHELMMLAADLKLNNQLHRNEKLSAVSETMEMLRLTKSKDTITGKLSGGERKRLSIAVELVNNPDVIFLDEPTTGLDDIASLQCILLLKSLSEGGRTVICSVHTPNSRIFALFNQTYIISEGQCVYQGYGPDVIPFLADIGLVCPTHYNPADFAIEVCSGEYGDYMDKMVTATNSNRNVTRHKEYPEDKPALVHMNKSKHETPFFFQVKILLLRMWKQMLRDKNYLLLKAVLHVILGVFIGAVFYGIGYDGSRTIYNFGYFYTIVIFFLYIPLMPILLQFPTEVRLLKREYFNRWYSLKAYYLALTISTIPTTILLSFLYLSFSYTISGQPLEVDRMLMVYSICLLTSFVSESFGLMISSTLNVVNSMFLGPSVSVPFMLLAVYNVGTYQLQTPLFMKTLMYSSYLRYSLEGISAAILQGRTKMHCPEEANEDYCIFGDPDFFLKLIGFEDVNYWLDIIALIVIFFVFRLACFYLIKQRLSPNKTFVALQLVVRLVKTQFGMSK